MPKTRSVRRPDIIIGETDADRLTALAEQMTAQPAAALLLAELARADVRADDAVPADVVGMNATVEFVDEASGAARVVRLVYPGEADIAEGKVSVMSPVGAGLIGLAAGQTILWPDREGRERALRVVRVAAAETV